jgi:hypothetical protein
MDSKSTVTDAAIRIRDSIDRFARTKNWARQDYHVIMIVNVVWISFRVEIYAKEYDSSTPDENARYDEIYDFLEEDLKDEPGLLEATSVLLYPLSSGYPARQPLGENQIQIDDSLLNPGWVQPQPMHHVPTG